MNRAVLIRRIALVLPSLALCGSLLAGCDHASTLSPVAQKQQNTVSDVLSSEMPDKSERVMLTIESDGQQRCAYLRVTGHNPQMGPDTTRYHSYVLTFPLKAGQSAQQLDAAFDTYHATWASTSFIPGERPVSSLPPFDAALFRTTLEHCAAAAAEVSPEHAPGLQSPFRGAS